MNNESIIVMRFYRLANIIRDCLEVVFNDEELNQATLEARGKFFATVMEDPMIKDFFEKSGDAGVTLAKHLTDLHNDIYVGKRFLNIKDGKYYSDKGSRIKLLDYIVGCYQSINDLLRQIEDDIKTKAEVDSRVSELLIYENDYYRALMFFAIYRTILALNSEMQEELKASQGNATPQANFILGELKKLVGFLKFVKEKYDGKNEAINQAFESIVLTIKFLDGSIKASDPKEIGTKVNETTSFCVSLIQTCERIWGQKFTEIINEIQPKNETKPQTSNEKH